LQFLIHGPSMNHFSATYRLLSSEFVKTKSRDIEPSSSIFPMFGDVGSVSPGTPSGATATQIPSATRPARPAA
jgi:hypothetical protein